MKKLIFLSLLGFAIIALLMAAPADDVLAQGMQSTVVLGDGAPIPYLEGFESELITDREALAGVTGALQLTWRDSGWGDGPREYQLQNIAITDDAIAVFFIQREAGAIRYEGQFQYAYNSAVRTFEIFMDGEMMQPLNEYSEGHPLDANTLYGVMLWSLPEPIQEGKTLVIGAQYNENSNAYEGGYQVTVDRSQAQDRTVAYQPNLQVKKTFAPWEGSALVSYDFVVERVAFTPFGNRIVLNFRGVGERDQEMDYVLADEAGNILPVADRSRSTQGNASKEHPVQNRSEGWFYGGKNSKQLTLVPIGGKQIEYETSVRRAVIPLGELPCDVMLETNAKLHITVCDISADHYQVEYTQQGYPGWLEFYLGDSAGSPLDFVYVSYDYNDRTKQLLGKGGYWSDEYKDKKVSRVSADDLKKVENLIVEYRAGETWMLTNETVTFALQ